MQYRTLVPELVKISKEAGLITLKYYNSTFNVEKKSDNSPVTEADKQASLYIVDKLKILTPHIPVVSEEEENLFETTSKNYWLVDPLDGTKSFIRKQGDFTVNIGLVIDNRTIAGFIYVPVSNEMYFTGGDNKAYFENKNGGTREIKTSGYKDKSLTVIASHSHRNEETDDFINRLDASEIISAASSLKFCVVAKGNADIYPRFNPTMQWDTAAGQAILEAAGGSVVDRNGEIFKYVMPEKEVTENRFLNDSFIARGWE